MNLRREWKALLLIIGLFLIFYFAPVDSVRVTNAIGEALALTAWYAREHVILCLLPAFFIAGAIAVFVSQNSVMKYLGARANKVLAYGVASVSGSVLAVCSCTVLPLFAGIYKMGAGLGPATAFLYAGPAINVLAIILTARVLGIELGIARAVGAIGFSVVIGLIMSFIFRREEKEKAIAQAALPEPEVARPLWQNVVYFALMILVLISATWGASDSADSFWGSIFAIKWLLTSIFSILLGLVLILWFGLSWVRIASVAVITAGLALIFPDQHILVFAAGIVGLSVITATAKNEPGEWFEQTWGFAKQIMPLLFFGVLAAGAMLGRPGHEGLIPSSWIAGAVGGNSLGANLFASVVGAFMYFATLTEIPILQGLIGNGMGKGPALALLLAGPALSLPNMLVIRSVMGMKKTIVFVALVIVMATITGMIYGAIF